MEKISIIVGILLVMSLFLPVVAGAGIDYGTEENVGGIDEIPSNPYIPPGETTPPFDINPDELPSSDIPSSGMTIYDNGLVDPNMIIFVATPLFTVTDPRQDSRYWRISTYDTWNGRDWYKSNDSLYNLTLSSPAGKKYQIQYKISPNTENVNFYVPHVWPVPYLSSFSYTNTVPTTAEYKTDIYNSSILSLYYSSSGPTTIEYDVVSVDKSSDIMLIKTGALTENHTPADISDLYTSLPENLTSDPVFQDHINNLTTWAPSFISMNVYDKAITLVAYMKTHFVFNITELYGGISNQPDAGEDAIIWFLQRKKGLSSHFASTFVATLRYFNVSARVVNGYLGGDYNGTAYEIRAKHAHYWAEVYVPVAGGGEWIEFDPTPLAGEPPQGGGGDPYVQTVRIRLEIFANKTVVNRGDHVAIYARLLQDGSPLSGYKVNFLDPDEGPLGSDITNASGYASIVITYTAANISGNHTILANFLSYYNLTFVGVKGNSAITLNLPQSVIRENGVTLSGCVYDPDTSPTRVFKDITLEVDIDNVSCDSPHTDENGNYISTPDISGYDIGPHEVNVSWSGIPGIVNGSYNVSTLVINTTTTINLVLWPNRARLNSTVLISGTVSFANGSSVGNIGAVTINWTWANGTQETVASGLSLNSSGGFETNKYISVYDCVGDSNISVRYVHISPYVLPSWTYRIINVFDGGLIYVYVNTTTFQHDEVIRIYGHLENIKGEPVPNFSFAILFNSSYSHVIAHVSSQNDGTYSVDIKIPRYDSNGLYMHPGYYNITAYGENSTLMCDGTYVESVLQTHVYVSLSVNTTQLYINENVLIEGELKDDSNVSLPVSSWIVLHGNGFYYNASVNAGKFSMILNASKNLTIGWNDILYNYTSSSDILLSTTGVIHSVVMVFDSCNISISVPSTISLGETLSIRVKLYAFDVPIVGRNVSIYINGRYQFSGITDENGTIRKSYIVPRDIDYSTITIKVIAMITGDEVNVGISVIRINILSTIINYILIPAIIGAIIVISVIMVFKRKKKRGRPVFSADGLKESLRTLISNEQYKDAVILLYQKTELLLKIGKALPISPANTPREVAGMAVQSGIPKQPLERLVFVFELAKYSNAKITRELFNNALQSFSKIFHHVTGGEFSLEQIP